MLSRVETVNSTPSIYDSTEGLNRPTLNTFISSASSQENTSKSASSRQDSSAGELFSSSEGSQPTQGVNITVGPLSSDSATLNKNATLQRRTTRDLIDMFERSSRFDHSPRSHSLRRGGIRVSLNAPVPEVPKAKPFRESFRSFLTMLGKGKKTSDQEAVSPFKRPLPERNGNATKVTRDNKSTFLSILGDPKTTISRIDPVLSPDIRSGTLLYYDGNLLGPAWHSCNAFLSPPNLHLSYFNQSGKQINRVLSVKGCIDARSIASRTATEVSPPTIQGQIPHVFEIEFGEGTTEKFAAASVLERGGWLSAIWDAMLSGKMTRGVKQDTPQGDILLSLPSSSSSKPRGDVGNIAETIPKRSDADAPASSLEVFSVQNSSESSVRLRFSNSASINKLDGLSLVKKRLAQLDNPTPLTGAVLSDGYATPPKTPPPQRPDSQPLSGIASISSHVKSPSPLRLSQKSPVSPGISAFITRNDSPSWAEVLDQYVDDSDYSTIGKSRQTLLSIATPPVGSTQGSSAVVSVFNPRYRLEEKHTHSQKTMNPSKTDESAGGTETVTENLFSGPLDHDTPSKKSPRIMRDLGRAMEGSPSTPLHMPQLNDLRERMEALASGLHSMDLGGLHKKIDKLKSDMEVASTATLKNEPSAPNIEVSNKVEEIKAGLDKLTTSDQVKDEKLREVLDKLATIQTLVDVPPPVPSKDAVELLTRDVFQENIGNIQKLLEEIKTPPQGIPETSLASLSVFKKTSDKTLPTPTEPAAPTPEILEILEVVKQEQEQRVQIVNQCADSVRYLNELNVWMEGFSNKTEDHQNLLQGLTQTVDRIAQALNTAQPAQNAATSSELGNIGSSGSQPEGPGKEVAKLVNNMESVLEALNISVQQQKESKETQDITSIVAVIEKSQQEQGALLRTIAEGISADIKGERLRFVDAMKDATSVNVANQLAEFKHLLSIEVSRMLEDVGKLARARERKHLEEEIAEIFKQEENRLQSMRSQRPQQQHQHQHRYQHQHQPRPQPQPQPQQHPQHYQLSSEYYPQGSHLTAYHAQPVAPAVDGPYPAFAVPPNHMQDTLTGRSTPLHPALAAIGQRPLPSPGAQSHYSTRAHASSSSAPPLASVPTRRPA